MGALRTVSEGLPGSRAHPVVRTGSNFGSYTGRTLLLSLENRTPGSLRPPHASPATLHPGHHVTGTGTLHRPRVISKSLCTAGERARRAGARARHAENPQFGPSPQGLSALTEVAWRSPIPWESPKTKQKSSPTQEARMQPAGAFCVNGGRGLPKASMLCVP